MKRDNSFFLHSSRKTQGFFFSLDLGSDVAWRFLALYFHPHNSVGEECNEFYALSFHTFLALLLFSSYLLMYKLKRTNFVQVVP